MSPDGLRASVAPMKPLRACCARGTPPKPRGDPTALDALLADDFRGDGPEGFVLDKGLRSIATAEGT